MTERLLTTKEAMEFLSCCRETLTHFVAEGKLLPVGPRQRGRPNRYREEDLARFLETWAPHRPRPKGSGGLSVHGRRLMATVRDASGRSVNKTLGPADMPAEEAEEKLREFMRAVADGTHVPGRHGVVGEDHPMWRDGLKMTPAGYVRVNVGRNDPMAHADGYVLLHRLIMAVEIGRDLLPTEQVHHINGNPTDNRIENLQLCANDAEHKALHRRKP